MTLVDYTDRPPPKRVPLPTKEQINAITDIPALDEMEQEIERRAEKITVDLEMEAGDENWDARARSALTAHRICLKNIRTRLHRLRRGDKPIQVEADAKRMEQKLQKAQALSAVKTAEAERAAAKAEKAQAGAEQQRLAMIRSTSFHMHFFRAARDTLERDVFLKIEAIANKRVMNAVFPGYLSEAKPND